MFAGGPGHECLAAGVGCGDVNLFRQIEPCLVGHDGGVKTGGFEFFGNVESGVVVFLRSSDVRRCGERLQLFASKLCVGNGEELLVDLCLRREVAIAEDGLRHAGILCGQGNGERGKAKSNWQEHDGSKGCS